MKYRASRIEQDPLSYFLQPETGEPFLQVADVMLRANKDPKEVFAHLIRMATDSKWSHSAILYLISDPHQGFNNTFLVEAKTKGIRLASWRNEVIPFDEFTVGIKRPCLDWYVENPYEKSMHNPRDPEDIHGIGYLRHVRGIAIDQINGLYDHKTVYELSALYAERVARRHLGAIPQVADAAASVANLFKKWDERDSSAESVLRFICSGLVQYSFFEALRRRIINDLAIPEHREAGLSNLQNLHRVIYREDPEGLIPGYIQQVQSGAVDIHDTVPDDVLDLLKTATPADFNNSPNLEWRYVILKGAIWRIEKAAPDYVATSKDEGEVLQMLGAEHRP
ncbi:hypothetical protein [Dictyobacter kobayashii]|uniref:Uncharacterized protein n=1 Tax=Dictyobacter kobayashii TaxID=2014872 RepID=A0A402APK2_9CHLR|nr:hypothetical protein [Dictyobacter kobayashii]GCE20984.1 hypothetical protein KDK_47840 [Dictyobacter kobayashii]